MIRRGAAPRRAGLTLQDNWPLPDCGSGSRTSAVSIFTHHLARAANETTAPDAAARRAWTVCFEASVAVPARGVRAALPAGPLPPRYSTKGHRDPDLRAGFHRYSYGPSRTLRSTRRRPIVVAGHSQGALHARTLLSDVIARTDALKPHGRHLIAESRALGFLRGQAQQFQPCARARYGLRGSDHLRPPGMRGRHVCHQPCACPNIAAKMAA